MNESINGSMNARTNFSPLLGLPGLTQFSSLTDLASRNSQKWIHVHERRERNPPDLSRSHLHPGLRASPPSPPSVRQKPPWLVHNPGLCSSGFLCSKARRPRELEKHALGWLWGNRSVRPAAQRLMKDQKFKACLAYIASSKPAWVT